MAKLHRNIGPDSRLLERGLVDGRSRVGRYLLAIEAEVGKQVGNPSFAQRLLGGRMSQTTRNWSRTSPPKRPMAPAGRPYRRRRAPSLPT